MSEIVDKWRSLQKGPRVPRQQEPPKTPRYDVKGIQSINPSRQEIARQQYSNRKKRIASQYVPATGSTMARRELTAKEMAGVYPGLVAKRPELLKRLSKRGVKYYIDPLLAQRGYGGTYDQKKKEVVVQEGAPALVAGHEITHADLATGPTNIVRFLTDSSYRSMRIADIIVAGGRWSGYAEILSGYGQEEVARGKYLSETFAMGAGGSSAYMDLPVDYYDANRLFGGTFDEGLVRLPRGQSPANTTLGTARDRWRR